MRKELEKLRYLDGCPWGMVMPSEREIVNHLVEAGMERVGVFYARQATTNKLEERVINRQEDGR